MSNPNARYREAKREGRDGILLIYQESDEHGPEMRFIDRCGLAFIKGKRLQAYGGVILGCWDTIGYDWIN